MRKPTGRYYAAYDRTPNEPPQCVELSVLVGIAEAWEGPRGGSIIFRWISPPRARVSSRERTGYRWERVDIFPHVGVAKLEYPGDLTPGWKTEKENAYTP